MGIFDHDDSKQLLKEILETLQTMQALAQDQSTLIQQLDANSIATNQLLQTIVNNTNPRFPTRFIIKETTMALQPPDPGATLQFTAVPLPAGSSLGTVVPVWSSSDTANITITTDATGLIATVVLGAAIPVGEVVTLTVSATDPVSGTLATGTATFTVGAPPPAFPTSFSVSQTS